MKPQFFRNAQGLLGLSLLMCGCTSTPWHPTVAAAATVVTMQFHSFEPKTVMINAGGTVRWDNKTWIWHTVTADPALAKKPEDISLPQGAEAFDSGKVDAGGSYQHTFTVPGLYRYFCQPHELNGMVGEIIVKPAIGAEEKK